MPSATNTPSERPTGADTNYEPYVLQNLDDATNEYHSTICAQCPAAIWYRQGVSRCFCSVMKLSTWPTENAAVTMCDAREAAVVKYAADRAKGPPHA